MEAWLVPFQVRIQDFFYQCYQAPWSEHVEIDLRLLLAPVLMENNGHALCPFLKTLNSMGWILGAIETFTFT